MPRLLDAVGFAVNKRTRRAPCLLHGGANPSAFSWTDTGLWKCHSCGAGGDKITLVRAVRRCSFREAVEFLAALAGVKYQSRRVSRQEIERARLRRTRAQRASWRIHDEIRCLRRCHHTAMLRANRLCWRIGQRIQSAATEDARAAGWDALAKLAPAQTFFLGAWNFFFGAPADALARAARLPPAERRSLILNWEPR